MARNPKAVALILGRLGKEPAEGAAPEEAPEEMDVGLEAAADEVLAAIHSGSSAELAGALKAFISQCSSSAGAYPGEE